MTLDIFVFKSKKDMFKNPLSVIFLAVLISLQSFSQVNDSIIKTDTILGLLPIKVLLKKNQKHSFSISPDGKYFAEVIENNVESDIYIIDIDEYIVHKRIPIGRSSIQNLYWLTSTRLIYESEGEIIAIDIDGTNSSVIADRLADKIKMGYYNMYKNFRFNSIVSLLPENKKEILVETYDLDFYATLKRVNIFTGQKRTIIDGKKFKVNKWITDLNGDVQLAIRVDDDEMQYLRWTSGSKKMEEFHVRINGVEYPLVLNAESYLEQNLSVEGFGYDPNILYLTSNIDVDKRQLIAYNINERKVEEVVLKDVNCDINDPHGKGITLSFNSDDRKLLGVRYDNLMPQHKWFSKGFSTLHLRLKALHPGFVNDVIDVDEKGERLLVHQWNDNSGGNIGVYDSTDETYSVMFNFNDELDKYDLSKIKNVIAKSRDGFSIPCYLNLPKDYVEGSKTPIVVIPHGGPWSRDYYEFDNFSQYFTSRGYATLRVNFRGSTGFGKKHVTAGINSIDDVMINDIADAVEFVTNKFKLNQQQIFLFGHSYGGYATYMSLIKYPDMYAAGVALSAPTDIKKWMKTQKKEKDYFTYEFWNYALGSKKSQYLSKISPINYTDSFEKPLLIFHGRRDKTIPLEQAERMIELLKKNGKNAELEILQNEGHSIYDSNSLGYILDSADEFFKESVKE